MIAFDQDADYDSPNFLWFRNRFARFIYVDRIVVAPSGRRQGFARELYRDLFVRARRDGHDVICCEVNRDPPNPVSDRFHDALGFETEGEATIPSGKTVSYLSRRLKDPSEARA
jgi:predicted GNAT superfamily acetyltransferase